MFDYLLFFRDLRLKKRFLEQISDIFREIVLKAFSLQRLGAKIARL